MTTLCKVAVMAAGTTLALALLAFSLGYGAVGIVLSGSAVACWVVRDAADADEDLDTE